MRRAAVIAVAVTFAACGGGGSPPAPAPPRIATPLPGGAPPGLTAFAQTVPAEDGLGEAFPGQANTWVLDGDFSLATGYGAQYEVALALYVGTTSAPSTHASVAADLPQLEPFPFDQGVGELTWLTPLFTAADGVRTAAASDGGTTGVPPLAGARSGYLNGTSGSRLSRTVTLSPGTSYSLAWTDRGLGLGGGGLAGGGDAPHGPLYQVVLRDPATDAVLADPLFAASADFGPAAHGVALPGGLSGPVAISFELRSAAGGLAVVDAVSLSPAPAAGFANGDFEGAALSPWIAGAGAESQNVRSGPRALPAGLDPAPALTVTRTFYAPPAASWARMVDVFENGTGAAVSTRAVYVTVLSGSLAAVRAGGRAIVGWDALGSARDVAIVHGDGTALVDPASNVLYVVHALTVPAGGKVALAHFVVQLGRTEGGATAAEVPPGTDAAAAAIARGFPAQAAYASDLEAGVVDLVANF